MGVHEGHRDRMKREFLQGGLRHFSEPRVLELLLFYSRLQGDVNPLAHRLLAPRHHVDKIYFVRADGELDGADAAAFAAGMMLEDGLACLPAGLEVLEQPDTALVTLHEGKYHQIKRMLAARGKPVVYLKRLTMGPLMLDPALERGEWRPLSAEEVAALRQA